MVFVPCCGSLAPENVGGRVTLRDTTRYSHSGSYMPSLTARGGTVNGDLFPNLFQLLDVYVAECKHRPEQFGQFGLKIVTR